MKTVAVIPARGGSKGIPRKNIVPLAGKPMLVWSIEAALGAGLVDAVYVSTDDDEIAGVALDSGAFVIPRPSDLSGDTNSSESALLHALDWLRRKDIRPETLVFMQCTSPLVLPSDVDAAVDTFRRENADSCFTATEFHYFVWRRRDDGSAEGINHDKRVRPRRQEREPQYVENGAVYVLDVKGFLREKHRFFGRTVFSLMPVCRSFEIDEPEDLTVVECLLGRDGSGPFKLPSSFKAVLFDFDGVFTDNKVYVSDEGREAVCCDRGDGWGISMLRERGVRMAVLSSEKNRVVAARCRKLKIECIQDLGRRKKDAFKCWCEANSVDPSEVVFVGNDVNDLDCLKLAGYAVVPADCHYSVMAQADYVLSRKGGRGCVRELCDKILEELSK